MPWAVASAAIAGGSAYYQGKKAEEAAEGAAERSEQAAQQAMARSDEAFGVSEEALAPWMGQERAASNQLMAQMGLAAPAGGWGAGIPTSGGGSQEGVERNVERFIRDSYADYVAIAMRAGYSEKNGKAQAEAARAMEKTFSRFKDQGKLPNDFPLPSYDDLYSMGQDLESQNFDWNNYARDEQGNPLRHRQGWDDNMILRHAEQIGGADALSAEAWAARQAGEGGAVPGEMGQPQAMQAEDILAMQGIEGLDPELRDQYMAQVMRSAETDPELAAYLGLTPETMSVGADYQQLPAYMRAMESGREEVAQAAAGAGGLYSGRRGEAVARMAHDVEGRYYDRAQREHEGMLGRRIGQRGAEIGLMGSEVAGGRQRQTQAYDQYMNMLMGLSAPTTTTNVAGMRQSAAAGQGGTLIDTARDVNQYRMMGTEASNAAIADVAGGLMEMGSAFIDRE